MYGVFLPPCWYGRYLRRGSEEERRECKLQLAEVFGLNSENDPFTTDGL